MCTAAAGLPTSTAALALDSLGWSSLSSQHWARLPRHTCTPPTAQVAQRCRKAGAPAAEVMCFDATDPASMDALGDGVLSRLGGPPSILVNGAGLSEGGGDLLTGGGAWASVIAD